MLPNPNYCSLGRIPGNVCAPRAAPRSACWGPHQLSLPSPLQRSCCCASPPFSEPSTGHGLSPSPLITPSSNGAGSLGEEEFAAAPTGWHPLSPLLWQGTEEEAGYQQATPYPLSPPWKIMLLSDGSVTRHLQLMTNLRVQVECLEMRSIGHQREGLPQQTELIPGPLVQRQVFLHIPDPHSKAYVYACSWWNEEEVDSYLRDRSQPIWVSLSQGRAELYREILQVEYGSSPYLEKRFQSEGPYWGRSYLFWHNGRPLTLIYEVFSTALEELLGPMRGGAAGAGG